MTDMSLYPEVCPHVIRTTPMRMEWRRLSMLHWRYPAHEVQRLLPAHVEVESFDGDAWVGLVPFEMEVDVPGLPTMASVLHFPETNVRTYVTGRDGSVGVWFFSLEASSLPAVITARSGYGVPYFWADMGVISTPAGGGHPPPRGLDRSCLVGHRLRYLTHRRRWPGPVGARSDVTVEIGEPVQHHTDLDRFLTARWALFGELGPVATHARMFHEPWPLHRATVVEWEDELVAAAGLSQPSTAPVVHYSPGVSVRCGWPRRVPH